MKLYYLSFLIIGVFLASCVPAEDPLNVPVRDNEEVLSSALDRYIEENFTKKYGMAIRYKFNENYVGPGERATAPELEVVRPMLDFIDDFWIAPYLDVEGGEVFFKKHVPAEIVFLGGPIFRSNGTIVLGTADAGAQITFTNVNELDMDNEAWIARQLNVVYHEFAHTVHQLYKLPTAYEVISPEGYTGPGSWFVLTDNDALTRGFVSPYATSSPNEDFAETVSFFLFDTNFEANYLQLDVNCVTNDCAEQNEGKVTISEKLFSIKDHYVRVTGVDLDTLRKAVQSRL